MLGLFNKKKIKALVVVDVQNDFIPGGALAVPKGDEVVPVINQLQPDYELIVATKDWHPRGHISFASRHPGTKVGDRVDLDSGSQRVWPDHCVQGTPGAEFAKGLTTNKFAKVFEKGIDPNVDSYSALYDNDQCRATGLEEWLKKNKVEEVYVVGLATDYTVKYTALDCAKAGYKTFVIKDACRAVNMTAGDEDRALHEMKTAGVTVK